MVLTLPGYARRMCTRTALWSTLGLLTLACGGGAPPAQSPADVPADSAPAQSASEPAATEDVGESPSSAAPVSDEDVSAILQLVLDDPELDAHLKLGEPGRFPLKVAGKGLPTGLKLVKATEPVKLSELPQSKADPVVVFTEVSVAGDKATVRYRYDVESLRGTATLARSAHGWELKSSRVVVP